MFGFFLTSRTISTLTEGDISSVGSRLDTSSHWESDSDIYKYQELGTQDPPYQCQLWSADVGAHHLGLPHTSLALGSLLQCSHNNNNALDTDCSHFIQDIK